MSNGYERENIDYVYIKGTRYTPDKIRGVFEQQRKEYFDLELLAAPIVPLSNKMRNADKMTANEKMSIDNSYYSFEGGSESDKRFMTEFDYYAALIRAAEDNADKVAVLKRRITAAYNVIEAERSRVYNRCLTEEGRKEMGTNSDERKAWFHTHYPALVEIRNLYSDFIDEIEIELTRWQDFSKAASRSLSATELSYQATGRLYTNKAGKYFFED